MKKADKKGDDKWWRKYTVKRVEKEFLEDMEDMEKELFPIAKIQKQFDKAFSGMFNNFMDTDFFNLLRMPRMKMNEGIFRKPIAEISEEKNSITVRAEIPGMKKEDINIRIENGNLVIDASAESKKEKEHLYSRKYKGFRSVIQLPGEVEKKGSIAKYSDGILTITLKKQKKHNSRDSGDIEIV